MNKIVLNTIGEACSKFDLLHVFKDVSAWVKDLNGQFVMVNNTFLDSYQLGSIDEIIGKTDYQLHPKTHADQYRADDELVLSGRHVDNRQEVIPSANNKIIWFITSKRPIFDTHNRIIGTFGFSRLLNPSEEIAAPSQELYTAIAYIERHYADKLTVAELANKMNLSVSALERRFKKHLLQTPRQYITEVRLNRAHELLLNTHKAISVIAQETGFSDNSHLTRCFIRRFAISPKQARLK